MKLNLPFYSQQSEKIEEGWRSRSCAILCLEMVMDFMGVRADSTSLIKEGLFISEDLTKKGKVQSGYTKEFGWGHELLVMLLRNKNIASYRQEFRSITDSLESSAIVDFGINKIIENIKNNLPVIVSVAKDEKNPRLSGHMVVITGFEEKDGALNGFYINDPEEKDELRGKDKFVDISMFKKAWKKLAIFVEK